MVCLPLASETACELADGFHEDTTWYTSCIQTGANCKKFQLDNTELIGRHYIASMRSLVLFQARRLGIGLVAALKGAFVYALRVQQEFSINDHGLARCRCIRGGVEGGLILRF